MWKKYLFFLVVLPLYTKAQTLSGMSGLLNIPSADMQADGTFIFGGNYLPEINQPVLGYKTGNYFLNLTFLPFLEVSYRMTLLKMEHGYTNQDRSASFRLRLLKERKYFPSVTFGVHDFHTTTTGGGNQYFAANYIVISKHLNIAGTDFGMTTGYGTDVLMKKNRLIGLFGGLAITPSFFKPLKLMGEYDTRGINLGGSLLLFKHLYLFSMAQHLQYLAGGVSYRIYL